MTNEQAFYLLKHFNSIDRSLLDLFIGFGYSEKDIMAQFAVIGSKFEQAFCQNPFDLESLINGLEPLDQIVQSNGRIASVYQFENVVGREQIVDRKTVNQNDIFSLDRNGVTVDAVKSDHLPFTNKLVVVRSDEGAWITAFPGNYAPAFPSSWMNDTEKELATAFWKNHVFVSL
jgi:hypothetical protein